MDLSNKITGIEDCKLDSACQLVKHVKVINQDHRQRPYVTDRRVRISYVRLMPDYDNYWVMISDNHHTQSFYTEPTVLDMITFGQRAYSGYDNLKS
jgi:hypothetical protein